MSKNIIGKIITVICIVSATIGIGIVIGMYMLSNIDFDKYNKDYEIEIVR